MEKANRCQICQCQDTGFLKPISSLSEAVLKLVFVTEIFDNSNLICAECTKLIEEIFKFKKSCLHHETSYTNVIVKTEQDLEICTEDINRNLENEEYNCNLRLCCICRTTFEDPIVDVSESNFIEMVYKCLPELDFKVKRDSPRCRSCLYKLDKYYSILQSLNCQKIKQEDCSEADLKVPFIKQEEIVIKEEEEECDTPNALLENSDEKSHVEESSKVTFECGFCNKAFNHKGNLKKHIRIHRGDKPFKCDVCKKHFIEKNHLMKHLIIHTGEKPFVCKVCDKHFTRKSHLKGHVNIHKEEKPFKCNICQKQFTERSPLNRHLRMHAGGNPFTCKMCNKQFTQKGTLMRHMRIHTGEKPFICDVCSRQFIENSHLIRHMKVHTGEKPFVCNMCDKQFKERWELNAHLKVHTEEKPIKFEFIKVEEF